MSVAMRLIVGLGNPGQKYKGTRHNVGFCCIDELARRWQVELSRRVFHGIGWTGVMRGERVLLLKPGTYMNLSGQSVGEAASFHKVAPSDLLVIVDDMALPTGRLRVRAKGSAGGHNGLSNIIERLGHEDFARVRIGIDQVRGERMVGHVLSPFTEEEDRIMEPAIRRAADAVECWLADGIDTAMNRYNRSEEQAGGSQEAR